MKRAVFLDRDGVINASIVKKGKPYPPVTRRELKLLPGVMQACLLLKHHTFLLIVVTNQPDVSRKKLTKEAVEDINSSIKKKLPVDDIYVCFHDDIDNCDCRKPKPGMLFQASKEWDIDLSRSFLVGDRWKDIEAGRKAGSGTILIDYGYAENRKCSPDYRTKSLNEAAEYIINRVKKDDDENKKLQN